MAEKKIFDFRVIQVVPSFVNAQSSFLWYRASANQNVIGDDWSDSDRLQEVRNRKIVERLAMPENPTPGGLFFPVQCFGRGVSSNGFQSVKAFLVATSLFRFLRKLQLVFTSSTRSFCFGQKEQRNEILLIITVLFRFYESYNSSSRAVSVLKFCKSEKRLNPSIYKCLSVFCSEDGS